jgi:hypothetical protein
MAASKEDIRRWLQEGSKDPDCTHVIVACDTFDYEDYPVYVKKGEDVQERIKEYSGKNMQRVMEVYSLTGKYSIAEQMKEGRAFHYD